MSNVNPNGDLCERFRIAFIASHRIAEIVYMSIVIRFDVYDKLDMVLNICSSHIYFENKQKRLSTFF